MIHERFWLGKPKTILNIVKRAYHNVWQLRQWHSFGWPVNAFEKLPTHVRFLGFKTSAINVRRWLVNIPLGCNTAKLLYLCSNCWFIECSISNLISQQNVLEANEVRTGERQHWKLFSTQNIVVGSKTPIMWCFTRLLWTNYSELCVVSTRVDRWRFLSMRVLAAS